jgi:anti-sigma regulatory factor (Ser/Thr protein kinase)
MKKRSKRTEQIQECILHYVEEHPSDIAGFTSAHFDISRQSVAKHIRRLVDEGLLATTGATKGKQYQLQSLVHERFSFRIQEDFKIEEDVVWRSHIRPLLQGVSPHVLDICQYGFTEMFNNALEHSGTDSIDVEIRRDANKITMEVIDFGVGLFAKLQKELGLSDPQHALLELTKGKLTTDPAHHTGEGIFFTSRMFDNFSILSSGLFYQTVNEDGDWLIEVKGREATRGTLVRMNIRIFSQRTSREVYEKYASHGGYDFSRTHVLVALARYGEEQLVSRSQARRVLARFERFREVLLDFDGVAIIGHSFADEIFRVFKNEHPEIEVIGTHMTPHVREMIDRAMFAGKETA